MLVQLTVGAIGSICNIIAHSVMMTALIKLARAHTNLTKYSALALSRVMAPAVCVLMAAHIFEVVIWALIYKVVGVASAESDLMYFAFVNYTTLGYGDITPVERWRLLGPVAAMNGILLFGWSTAVIFEILRRTLIHMDELTH
ncbi:potassium channel family protein [Methylobacterium nodulans]|uniref:Ion transport 2 domain protein n=1 Tax=Methylobacterium nodulans (strain LMG 21967 / CNCM I-2342 / ORS 2060) TaxID=460265 RepID=B8IA24_METNO|nr:potassium channel family protein [Methylobacterium nodulans]ACL57252.1 Ion transport 2 domain protein [Methylobacterium nodulans ORS 2060]